MAIDKSERNLLIVFSGLVVLELISDFSIAQIPVLGDLANTVGDGALNAAELGIAAYLAAKN
jgi:hypothetical protein